MSKEKINSIKFYSCHSSAYNDQSPKNFILKSNITEKEKNNILNFKKSNFILYSSKNNHTKKNLKEFKNITDSVNYNNKNLNLIIDKIPKKEENLMNNSVNINNINLINSMSSITFYDSRLDNNLNRSKKNNITVNKKQNLKEKKNNNTHNINQMHQLEYCKYNLITETNNNNKNNFKYKNYGINLSLNKSKENKNNKSNNNININNFNNDNKKVNLINVNKLSKKDNININLKFKINEHLNKLKLLHNSYSDNNKNNRFNYTKKTKSEEKNSQKFNISNTGNNTTLNKNSKKIFYSRLKSENKGKQNDIKDNINMNNAANNNYINNNENVNKSNPKISVNIYNDIINSFEKIEVNKKSFKKNYYISKPKERLNNNNNNYNLNPLFFSSFSNIKDTRNESLNPLFKKTHQDSWTKSTEKINSFSNKINIKEKNVTPERTQKNIIYNKKQLTFYNNNNKSCNNINKILSPLYKPKKYFFENFEKLDESNDIKDNNNKQDIAYMKKNPINSIYKKPDLNYINNNSFLLINKEHLNKNKINDKRAFNINKIIGDETDISSQNSKKDNFKKKLNSRLYKFLGQKENNGDEENLSPRKIDRNNFVNMVNNFKHKSDQNELSLLLNSDNNNSKAITLDTNINTNFNVNEISININTKLNTKITCPNNFIKKFYSYFIQSTNINKQLCFISKIHLDNERLIMNNLPKKNICDITKLRKGFFYILPKIDICFFEKRYIKERSNNLNVNYNDYGDISFRTKLKDDINDNFTKECEYDNSIKSILTERTSIKKWDNYNNNKIINATKKIVNIEKYNNVPNSNKNNNLIKTERGLKLLEKIADKRNTLSSLLNKKNKQIFSEKKYINQEFMENLNIITYNNYEIILENISNLILSNNKKITNENVSHIIVNQNEFIDIIITKSMKEKEKKFIKIYSQLCKDLFINLMTIINNSSDDMDIFDKLTKEKSLKKNMKAKLKLKIINDVKNDYKNLFYFIAELLENKILSIKTGFEFLDILFKKYSSTKNNDIYLQGIEILLNEMIIIINIKNNQEHIQRYNKYIKNHLFNIFKEREKSKDLNQYLYYRIYNLIYNINFRKKNFLNDDNNLQKNEIYRKIKEDLNLIINKDLNSKKNKKFFYDLNTKYTEIINKNKNIDLCEFLYNYIEVCIDLINSEDKIKFANDYINYMINTFISKIQNELWEILRLKLISLFLNINDICVDNIYMYQIMGYFLFLLIQKKLFYIKDLNNFLEKENYVIINISKVVKYTIIFSEKDAKKFHNDFKQTKLFFGNDTFYKYVTLALKQKYYEI